MDKEKEEMYNIVKCGLDIQLACGDEIEIGDKEAAAEIIVEDLQKAGYGNVEQAVKEFAEKVKTLYPLPVRDDKELERYVRYRQAIDNLIKERYGEDEQ